MKLYVTYTSPYARLARIVIAEKALEDRVEIIDPEIDVCACRTAVVCCDRLEVQQRWHAAHDQPQPCFHLGKALSRSSCLMRLCYS